MEQWSTWQIPDPNVKPNRLTVVEPGFGNSAWKLKVELQDGDVGRNEKGTGTDIPGGWRAEVLHTSTPPDEVEGRTSKYEWATQFDASYPTFPSDHPWQVITQWHQCDDGCVGSSPPIEFVVERGAMRFHLNKPDPAGAHEIDQEIAPITPGVWHKLRMEVKWSTAANGYVKVWHNDTEPPIVNQTATLTLFPCDGRANCTPSVYLKMGLYREAVNERVSFILFHDEMKKTCP